MIWNYPTIQYIWITKPNHYGNHRTILCIFWTGHFFRLFNSNSYHCPSHLEKTNPNHRQIINDHYGLDNSSDWKHSHFVYVIYSIQTRRGGNSPISHTANLHFDLKL